MLVAGVGNACLQVVIAQQGLVPKLICSVSWTLGYGIWLWLWYIWLYSILIFHTTLQDCARDFLSERLKKEGKKTGVLKTSCRLRAFC